LLCYFCDVAAFDDDDEVDADAFSGVFFSVLFKDVLLINLIYYPKKAWTSPMLRISGWLEESN